MVVFLVEREKGLVVSWVGNVIFPVGTILAGMAWAEQPNHVF